MPETDFLPITSAQYRTSKYPGFTSANVTPPADPPTDVAEDETPPAMPTIPLRSVTSATAPTAPSRAAWTAKWTATAAARRTRRSAISGTRSATRRASPAPGAIAQTPTGTAGMGIKVLDCFVGNNPAGRDRRPA